MTTIKSTGTATQICEWLGVPDPSIHHVMRQLQANGLSPSSPGQAGVTSPEYPTVEAFKIYYGLTGQLPPEAVRYLRRALEEQQTAETQAAAVRAAAEAAQQEQLELKAAERREQARMRAIEHQAALAEAAKQKLEAIEADAQTRGLTTYHMAARRYDKLSSDGKAMPVFQAKLNKAKLEVVEKVGSIKLFRQADVDAAVQSGRIRPKPVRDWAGNALPPEETTPNTHLWSAEAFLRNKKINGKPIDPADYDEIERELKTAYGLVAHPNLGPWGLYRHSDWQRAFGSYLRDME